MLHINVMTLFVDAEIVCVPTIYMLVLTHHVLTLVTQCICMLVSTHCVSTSAMQHCYVLALLHDNIVSL